MRKRIYQRRARRTIYELVEAEQDKETARKLLNSFNASEQPPSPPSEFTGIEDFFTFHRRKLRYEGELNSLQARLARAEDVYAQAKRSLQDILPENTRLHFTYEGRRQELAGTEFLIINRRLGPNQAPQITISITGRL